MAPVGQRISQDVPLAAGSEVMARYRGRTTFFRGKVQAVHPDGSVDIHYADGDIELGMSPALVRRITDLKPTDGHSVDSADPALLAAERSTTTSADAAPIDVRYGTLTVVFLQQLTS